jgi:O-acetyl-ADP-ribose deacetylase (regulator of RNase III)
MGKLKFVKGNLFDTKDGIIAHGCNCRGGFGSGVAGQIARLYPQVREAYLGKFERSGWKLGQVQFVPIEDSNLIIANMATQDKFGYDGGLYVDYEAIRTAFDTVCRFAEEVQESISLPWIGTGLGGGERGIIQGILVDCLKTRNVTATIYSID